MISEEEYKRIKEILKREPNEFELGVFSVLWSEHCSYKSSKPLLKKFPTQGEGVVLGPGENAGVVELEGDILLVFKVESHNHPSYVEPFHGAATGVGGIIRDVLSMGARPVALGDSLRFGELSYKETKEILKGVVEGISFYGNCIGIPTVCGETYFEESYNKNPLVNAFCLGIVKRDKLKRARAKRGLKVAVVGARTGRDGLFGAVMASEELKGKEKKGSVQIGDPYFGKKLLEFLQRIIDEDLVYGIQDLGAGGLCGALFEVCNKSGVGAKVELERVPLREEGMSPYEIFLSESQERMLLILEDSKVERVRRWAEVWNLSFGLLGEFTEGERVRVFFKGKEVLNLPFKIVESCPLPRRERREPEYLKEVKSFNPNSLKRVDVGEALKKLLKSPNIRSKRFIYEQYDYSVGTNTIVGPGSESALLRIKWSEYPKVNSPLKVAVSCEGNGRMVFLDPYEGAIYITAELLRNLACTGAKPIAITDCLNFGNPEEPWIMYQLEKAVEGIAEVCKFFNVPVISGNVSLYNGRIYPTPVLFGVGKVEGKYLTSHFKGESSLYLIGDLSSEDEVGGSEFLKVIFNKVAGKVPKVDLEKERRLHQLLLKLIEEDVILSAKDVSLGGLLINILECTLEDEVGLELEIYTERREDFFLFCENPTRVIVSVREDKEERLKELTEGYSLEWLYLGRATRGKTFKLNLNGETLMEEDIRPLKAQLLQGIY